MNKREVLVLVNKSTLLNVLDNNKATHYVVKNNRSLPTAEYYAAKIIDCSKQLQQILPQTYIVEKTVQFNANDSVIVVPITLILPCKKQSGQEWIC